MGLTRELRYYLKSQSSSLPRYILEQTLMTLLGGLPSLVGIGLRGIIYKAILQADGVPLIEHNVRLLSPGNIRLGKNVYLDSQVYLNALPGGITIGAGTSLMHGTVFHVFNYRDLPHAGITVGQNCFFGEYTCIRGQGGVKIGDGVYTGTQVNIAAVNHVFADPNRFIREQGITADGITIEDDVWLGSNATVVDGVTIGRGSIVGAGAVVTKDIPPYSIAVGVPAKVVGDRRDPEAVKRFSGALVFYGELEELRK
ncbi:MAG: acyltransferase [Chloroflexi bacterium]|nr:acyltransferase [Chloroflexota bacterium]MDL1883066.1 acyltransferase [Anaerolineae bacterium CFX8]